MLGSRKEQNPDSILVVCGCLGQLQREKLLEKCKEIDVLAGTHNWEDLPFLIQRAWWEKEKIVAFRETPPPLYEEKGYWHSNRISAYLPITFGCDNFCSYCVVPYTTGRQRSKPVESARIGTDIIVGFPGETDSDFRETLDVVREAQFDVAYTYVYSPRPGTAAYLLEDDIPVCEKKERLHILNDTLRSIYQEKLPSLQGKVMEILIDQEEGGLLSGRGANNLRVYLKELFSAEVGEWREVVLTPGEGNKVYGSVKR